MILSDGKRVLVGHALAAVSTHAPTAPFGELRGPVTIISLRAANKKGVQNSTSLARPNRMQLYNYETGSACRPTALPYSLQPPAFLLPLVPQRLEDRQHLDRK